MGDAVNVFLDDLDALLLRLLHFPLAFQLLIWFLFALLASYLILLLLRLRLKSLDKRARMVWILAACALSLIVASATLIDRKIKLEASEAAFVFPVQNAITKSEGHCPEDLLAQSAIVRLSRHADNVERNLIYRNAGLELIGMKFTDHPVMLFLARIDLCRYDIILDTAITEKELLTDFAKRFDAEIVINGEAGTSPGMGAPLGEWTGNYIVQGKVLMMEDRDDRPFFYFNKNSKASYSRGQEVITRPVEGMYNAIWGRFDLIVEGKEAIDARDRTKGNPYPRTIIGCDSTGLQLYLMIVDGRNPEHSVGLTMKECAEVLLPLGVYHAMACDQGGSSAMYIKGSGIVNRPADGMERAVYTHLGLRSRY
jgi:hypothetical protein